MPPNVNQGGPAGPPRVDLRPGHVRDAINNDGYGWAQWSFGRKVNFIQFSIDSGFMASQNESATDAANYANLKRELAESYTSTIDELKRTNTPEDAAASFHETYESSADNAQQLAERGASARQAYNEYHGRSGSGRAVGVGDNCPMGGGAAVVGDFAFPLIVNKSDIRNAGIFSGGTTGQGEHPYIAYDIYVDEGKEVVAAMSGTVTRVTTDRCPGRMISIYNEASNMTISYLHLSFSNHIAEGTQVQPGDHVGVVGNLAQACNTTTHLHIDAVTGDSRPSCSRLNCPVRNQAYFTDIGPQLFESFQALPD